MSLMILHKRGLTMRHPVNMAFVIARGTTSPCDISIFENSHRKMYSFCGVEWALPADVDINSEPCRCCGDTRFILRAVQDIWCTCRSWKGRLHYLPAEEASREQSYGSMDTGRAKGEDVRMM